MPKKNLYMLGVMLMRTTFKLKRVHATKRVLQRVSSFVMKQTISKGNDEMVHFLDFLYCRTDLIGK